MAIRLEHDASSSIHRSTAMPKKATAASSPRKPAAKRASRKARESSPPVGVTQIAREALMEALSAIFRAAQRALAAARDVGSLALQAVRQIFSGTAAGLGEVFGRGKPRRAAARA